MAIDGGMMSSPHEDSHSLTLSLKSQTNLSIYADWHWSGSKMNTDSMPVIDR